MRADVIGSLNQSISIKQNNSWLCVRTHNKHHNHNHKTTDNQPSLSNPIRHSLISISSISNSHGGLSTTRENRRRQVNPFLNIKINFRGLCANCKEPMELFIRRSTRALDALLHWKRFVLTETMKAFLVLLFEKYLYWKKRVGQISSSTLYPRLFEFKLMLTPFSRLLDIVHNDTRVSYTRFLENCDWLC